MSTPFPLVSHASELPTIAANYASDDMMQVKAHLELLHELPLQAGNAVRLLCERLAADYPLHPPVIEQMHQLYEGFCALVATAQEVSETFSTAHAEDIARHEAPRVNERMWNVQ